MTDERRAVARSSPSGSSSSSSSIQRFVFSSAVRRVGTWSEGSRAFFPVLCREMVVAQMKVRELGTWFAG